MSLKNFRLIQIAPCTTGGGKWRVLASFDREIGELLPRCNALLERAAYDPVNNTLTTRCYGRPVILGPGQVVIGQLPDPGLAEDILEALMDFLNRVIKQRDTITPLYEPKLDSTCREIYRLLPRTNCGACREGTCMAFAFSLWRGERLPEHCPALSADGLAGVNALLEKMQDPLLP